MHDKIDINIGNIMASPVSIIFQSKGIGSSIVVCLYDKNKKVGGIARILTPKANNSKVKETSPARFAKQGIDHLFKAMLLLGCEKKDIKAKIIGGACLFPKLTDIDAVSKENIKTVKAKLKQLKIPIIAEDISGNKGRSILFNTKDGSITIKQLNQRNKTI